MDDESYDYYLHIRPRSPAERMSAASIKNISHVTTSFRVLDEDHCLRRNPAKTWIVFCLFLDLSLHTSKKDHYCAPSRFHYGALQAKTSLVLV